MQFWGSKNLLMKTMRQVLCCQIYKLFKNIYFKEHLWTSASKLKRIHRWCFLVNFVSYSRTGILKRICKWQVRKRQCTGLFLIKLQVWRHLKVFERDSSTAISLWILWDFLGSFFAEHLLATTSHMMFFFSFLQIIVVFSLKSV